MSEKMLWFQHMCLDFDKLFNMKSDLVLIFWTLIRFIRMPNYYRNEMNKCQQTTSTTHITHLSISRGIKIVVPQQYYFRLWNFPILFGIFRKWKSQRTNKKPRTAREEERGREMVLSCANGILLCSITMQGER